MSNKPKSLAYRIHSYTGSANRQLGTFFKAGIDAPEIIKGKYIFYRLVANDYDLYLYKKQTNGFSTPAFEQVKADGVEYIVTQSLKTGRTVIGHVDAYAIVGNYSQGVQTHAALEHCLVLDTMPRLQVPYAVNTIRIDDEEPSPQDWKPKEIQTPLQGLTPKGTYRRCGCLFVNGLIKTPCGSHKELWPNLRTG